MYLNIWLNFHKCNRGDHALRLQGVDAPCTLEEFCTWTPVVCFEVAEKMISKVNFGCGISVYWKNAIYCNSLRSAGNANNGSCCCGIISSSSATLGTCGSEGTSKMPGFSSMCKKQASHNCWCSIFLLIAEMGSGLGHSQCCLLPGAIWEGRAARQMSAAVTENCQDSEYCCA